MAAAALLRKEFPLSLRLMGVGVTHLVSVSLSTRILE
jgi:hypothetical protein